MDKQEFVTEELIFDNGDVKMYRTNLNRVGVYLQSQFKGIYPSVESAITRRGIMDKRNRIGG